MLYLVQFYDDCWLDFCYSELYSLLLLFNVISYAEYNEYVKISYENQDPDPSINPYFYFLNLPNLNNSTIESICGRSIMIRAIYESWGHGTTLSECVQQVAIYSETIKYPIENSWAIHIDSFNKTLTMNEKESIRYNFSFLPFNGKVDVIHPQEEMWIVLDFSNHKHSNNDKPYEVEMKTSTTSNVIIAANDVHSKRVNDNGINLLLPNVPTYFGKVVGKGGMREEMRKYDLKKRLYLGPTSLDDGLAFILSNFAGIKKGDLVFDPFVGTGSILIALSHRGAVCWGGDIDTRVLRGEMHAGKKEEIEPIKSTANNNSKNGKVSDSIKRNVFENFKSYGLPCPELIRMDNHMFDRHCKKHSFLNNHNAADNNSNSEGIFDAIVTDPPYGIRAGAKKSGKSKPLLYTITPESRHDHIPATQHYPVEEVMLDLLHTSARSLIRNGVLVYLIPTTYDFKPTDLPKHPCFELVLICHQSLSARHGRRAVVMRKIRDYTIELEEEFNRYKTVIMSGQDTGFGQLMGKLEAALAANAYDNDAVVKILSTSSSKRKASKDFRKKQRE
eukprot:gene13685-18361_t